MERLTFIREMLSGKRGEISSKRVIAFAAFIVAVFGFFFGFKDFAQFLYFCAAILGGTLFERK